MKLTGIQYKKGVDSLGRHDVSGPARESAALKSTLKRFTDTFEDIGEAMDGAQSDLQWTTAAINDKLQIQQMNEYLKNNKSIDLESDDTPAFIKDTLADKYSGVVKTYDVMEQVMGAYVQDVYSKSVQGLRSSEEISKYNKAMDDTIASKTSEIVGLSYEWKGADVKDTAKAQFDAMVHDLDEKGALLVAQNNLDAGIWDQDTYNDKVAEMGSTIDTLVVDKSIRMAETVDQLDEIEEQLLEGNLRLNETDRRTLLKQRDAKLEDLEKRREMRWDKTYIAGMEMYANGKLTREWVSEQARNNNIDPEKLNLLYEKALQSPSYAMKPSDPSAMNSMKVTISNIPFTATDVETVQDRAKKARAKLLSLLEGDEAIINGEDYANLMKEIDQKEQSAMTGAPDYSRATNLINNYTGFTELDYQALGSAYDSGESRQILDEGAYQKKAANADFKAALHDYMSHAGGEADLVGWVNDHKKDFAPEKYIQDAQQTFMGMHPEYRDKKWGYDKDTGSALNKDKVLADVGARLNKGELKSWEAKRILRLLGKGDFRELIK